MALPQRELYEWLHPVLGLAGPIAMLKAFFDESESQNPRDVFVVGGYVSIGSDWARFGSLWTKTLKDAGVDPPVFHATDFEKRADGKRSEPFDELTDTRALAMQRRLLRLILRFTGGRKGLGVAEGLPTAEYEALLAGPYYRDSEAEDFADPYVPCMLACLQRIVKYQDQKRIPPGIIACTIDQGYKDEGRVVRMYRYIVATHFPGRFLETLAIGDRREVVPLQAADELAFEMMKELKNGIVGPKYRMPRRSLRRLRETYNLQGGYYHPDLIRSIALDVKNFLEARARR